MLLRNRLAGIETDPATDRPNPSYAQVADSAIAVMRWLGANHVDYVLVGPVARAVRGDTDARGAVAIVPAPYGRNLDRLARALVAARARLRVDGDPTGPGRDETVPVKVTPEKLVRAERWTLRCGNHDLDVEGRPAGVPRYQELLYEASRTTLAADVTVEVGAPEDVEHYDHVRRTGRSPQITVTRAVQDVEAH